MTAAQQTAPAKSISPMAGWVVFLLIAVAGLFYVKWFPYYNRAFVAAANHSIGPSILMGGAASPPAPSWDAALGYALAYGKSIWQAMVLGLLLGSAVQALLPVQWVGRLLGKTGFGSVARGGLLSIPGMMCTCCAAPVVVGLRERQPRRAPRFRSGSATRYSIPRHSSSWVSSSAGTGRRCGSCSAS